jgi:hypothetical protein
MFLACVLVINTSTLISEVKLLLVDLKVITNGEGEGNGQRIHIIFQIVVKFVLFQWFLTFSIIGNLLQNFADTHLRVGWLNS